MAHAPAGEDDGQSVPTSGLRLGLGAEDLACVHPAQTEIKHRRVVSTHYAYSQAHTHYLAQAGENEGGTGTYDARNEFA